MPRGVSDSLDGTNSFTGAMSALTNLIQAPTTKGLFVGRPATVELTPFGSFTSPTAGTCLCIVGDIAYGMISSGLFAGKDQPFAYNLATNSFQTISGMLAANLPTTQATTGDWTPPRMAMVASRVIVCHPGFPGGATKFGWLDISGFTSNTITGTTHTSTLIDTLSTSPITAGWQPGMAISGTGIPAGTTVVSFTATSVTISQATTSGGGGVTLTVTGGTATAPQWGAGDTNTVSLTATPVDVAQFNGRAYFAVGTGVQLSDSGFPCIITNTSQALTFRNGLNVTALTGQALVSTTTGGAIQALFAFQGASQIQQITGDPTTTNLTSNALTASVGTLAPNSICNTPLGTAFIAPDGLRIIDAYAKVSEPIGANGAGVQTPFLYAVNPTRICGAFSQNVMRVTVKNGAITGQPTQEWWLDFDNKSWSGPHTCPWTVLEAWQTSNGNTFVGFPNVSLQSSFSTPTLWNAFLWGVGLWGGTPVPGLLMRSDVQPSSSSVYTERGASMSFTYTTVLLPDNEQMSANQMVETSVGVMLPGAASQVTVQALNEAGTALDTVYLQGTGVSATLWNGFVWGGAPWGGGTTYFAQRTLDWHVPVVFKQSSIAMTGTLLNGLGIGNLYMRYRDLGYQRSGVP
jgi:hypothetical protein